MKLDSVLPFALAGLLAFGGVALAQDDTETKERPTEAAEEKALDPAEAMKALKAKYGAFKDLSMNVKQSIQMGPMAIDASTKVLWKGGKLRTESKQVIPMMGEMETTVVNDGEKAWMWRSAPRSVYTEMETDSPMLRQGDAIVLSLLAGDMSQIEGADVKACEVTVDGKKLTRFTIKQEMGGQGVTMTYDFDEKGLPVKASQLVKMDMGGEQGQPNPFAGGIKIEITYNDVKVDSGLADDLFKFTAPEGAEKVDGLGGMGMPGMPGGGGGMGGGRKGGGKKPAPAPKEGDDEDF